MATDRYDDTAPPRSGVSYGGKKNVQSGPASEAQPERHQPQLYASFFPSYGKRSYIMHRVVPVVPGHLAGVLYDRVVEVERGV